MIYNTIYDVKFNFQFLKRKQCVSMRYCISRDELSNMNLKGES